MSTPSWQPPQPNIGGDPYVGWGLATNWSGQPLPSAALWLPLLTPLDGDLQRFLQQADPDTVRAGRLHPSGARWGLLWVRSDGVPDARKALPVAEPSQARGPLQPATGTSTGVSAGKAAWGNEAAVVMAAIDGGGAFLNRVFRRHNDTRRTRFVAIWDQDQDADPKSGTAWAVPGEGYGRELRSTALQTLCRQADAQPGGERAVYAALGLDDLLLAEAQDRPDHATHVLDTLAGLPPRFPRAACSKPDVLDAAAQAPLILVSTPRVPPGQTTGASTAAQVLDGLHYILERATELNPHCPVVVNISLGVLGGPHDGTAPLEQAIDGLMQQHPQLLVVMAAGNTADGPAFDAGGLLQAGEEASLGWRLQPHDPTDSFLEFWWQGPGSEQLQLCVQEPYASDWVCAGQMAELREGRRLLAQLSAQSRSPLKPDGASSDPGSVSGEASGKQGLDTRAGRGQLSLAPIQGERGGLPAGVWQLGVLNAGHAPVQLRAWVQGDGPRWSSSTSAQSLLERTSGGVALGAAGSLSGLATGLLPLVVGAARADGDERSPYSSHRGTVGGREVDALALADEGALAPGLMAAGVLSGTWVRMSGTSVATPVAARHWAQRAVELGVPASGETWRQRLLPRTRGDNKPPPIRPARRA